jgi:hypothetical protein
MLNALRPATFLGKGKVEEISGLVAERERRIIGERTRLANGLISRFPTAWHRANDPLDPAIRRRHDPASQQLGTYVETSRDIRSWHCPHLIPLVERTIRLGHIGSIQAFLPYALPHRSRVY